VRNARKKLTNNSLVGLLFFTAVIFKFLLILFFSSDYLHKMFIPFVQYFIEFKNNPWNFFYLHQNGVEFPYNPLMLYILAIFYAPVRMLGLNSIIIQNFFIKLPTLLSDLLITYLLFKSFPEKPKEILFFYFASPIILYAAYMHSQLDLIPTAFTVFSIYCLRKNKLSISGISVGLALSIKLHLLAALPLIVIYIARNYGIKEVFKYSLWVVAPCLFFIGPYLLSEGFRQMVFFHPKQMSIFNVYTNIGDFKIYLPVCAILGVYGRFMMYEKINTDLLDAFLGMVFALFVLLIIPAPAWYIWMLPFMSMFLIKQYKDNKKILLIYSLLNGLYLLFFICFYKSPLIDLYFLNHPINLNIPNQRIGNLVFTLLDVSMVLAIYALYRFGIRSNSIYKKMYSLVLGIGGNSGTGKSILMSDIKSLLGKSVTEIEGDGDHKWERGDSHWKSCTHLDPKANYLHRQAENILMLKMGKPIYRVHYDHTSGKFTKPEKIVPNDFVIINGLHPFYLPKMRKLIDVKIYLDPEAHIREHWKIARDIKDRGYSKEKVLEQLAKRTPDSQKHIDPQKDFADIVIRYFANQPFDVGNINEEPILNLKITLDSSVRLDSLLHEFLKRQIPVEWDYSIDLKTQYLVLQNPISADELRSIANGILSNINEITKEKIEWECGFRGFTQLIILVFLSEKMKESEIGC